MSKVIKKNFVGGRGLNVINYLLSYPFKSMQIDKSFAIKNSKYYERKFACKLSLDKPGIFRDKNKKPQYDYKQNYHFCGSKLLVNKFGHYYKY